MSRDTLLDYVNELCAAEPPRCHHPGCHKMYRLDRTKPAWTRPHPPFVNQEGPRVVITTKAFEALSFAEQLWIHERYHWIKENDDGTIIIFQLKRTERFPVVRPGGSIPEAGPYVQVSEMGEHFPDTLGWTKRGIAVTVGRAPDAIKPRDLACLAQSEETLNIAIAAVLERLDRAIP